MTDRPILFSAPMVRALLAGRKTETRRVLKGAWPSALEGHDRIKTWFAPPHVPSDGIPNQWAQSGIWAERHGAGGYNRYLGRAPYRPGDRLWVREAWRVSQRWDDSSPSDLSVRSMTVFMEAGGSIANQDRPGDWRPSEWPDERRQPDWAGRLRPGIHMPRWASRLTLTVTCVCVERLQHISEEDAVAEGLRPDTCAGQRMWDPGIQGGVFGDPRVAYRMLWDHLNGSGAWDANPWVAAISFTVERRNIDAAPEVRP